MSPKIVWSIILLASIVGAQQQYIHIYKEPNCSGELIANFSGTTSHVFVQSDSVSFELHGVWRIKAGCSVQDHLPVKCPNEGTLFSGQGQGECNNYTNSQTIGWLVARRYGEESLTRPELYLFSQFEFYSLERTVTRSQETMGQSGIQLGSYLFTGSQSWTLYSEANFTGTATCLRPSEEIIQKQYGITFNTNYTQMVNSLQVGCLTTAGPPETSSSTNLHTAFSFLVIIVTVNLSQFLQ